MWITHLPLRECSTAFSMNSVIVCDLNLAYEPNEKVPATKQKERGRDKEKGKIERERETVEFLL